MNAIITSWALHVVHVLISLVPLTVCIRMQSSGFNLFKGDNFGGKTSVPVVDV